MNSQHDLYYRNFPRQISKSIKIRTYLGFQKFVEKLLIDDRPSYFYNGLNRILKLENQILSRREFEYLNQSGLNIYLLEPLCYLSSDSHNCEYYSEFIGNEKINSIKSNELESIKEFIIKNNLKNIRIFTCDYNITLLKENYPELDLNCYDPTIRNLGYNIQYKIENNKKEIKKKFWSSHRRYTLHRHLLMSYLSSMDGLYGWNFICDKKALLENPWFNFSNLDSTTYQKIIEGNNKLNNSTSIIDSEFLPENVNEYTQSVSGMGTVYKFYNDKFLNSLDECFCAVVGETRYAQPITNISEKTFHPIFKKTPFILGSTVRSLEYLKKLNFKTFDKWWDESYDQEENNEKRMLKIFKIIDFINSKNITELQNIYEDMKEVLDHNFNILKTLSMDRTILQ